MGVQLQLVSLGLGLMAAKQQQAAYKIQAEQYRQQAKDAKLQADQQEIQREDQLRRTLAALGVSGASRGVSVASPSQAALRKDELRMAANDISSIKLMGASNRRKFEIGAASSEAGGKAVMLGAGAKAATQAYQIMNPPYTKTT